MKNWSSQNVGFVTCLVWLSSLFAVVDASFTLTLEPGTEECYIIRTSEDKRAMISGTYDCLDDDVEGSALSVSITNFDDGASLFEAPHNAREGNFMLKDVPEGSKYALCFQNNFQEDDDDNEFDVGFSIRVDNPPRSLASEEIGPDAERALKLAEKATQIHHDWEEMQDHLMFVRNREAIHMSMNDAILARLSRWTYIEAFLVIGMATGQVLYWKKFFETRRYL